MKKNYLIIAAVIIVVALICIGVYYFFIDGHVKFGCKKEMKWVCPEWVEKCYEEVHAGYDTACPREDFVCEYNEVEVCIIN